ncbi:TnpV protein [uncultured Enterococcus sp.]
MDDLDWTVQRQTNLENLGIYAQVVWTYLYENNRPLLFEMICNQKIQSFLEEKESQAMEQATVIRQALVTKHPCPPEEEFQKVIEWNYWIHQRTEELVVDYLIQMIPIMKIDVNLDNLN